MTDDTSELERSIEAAAQDPALRSAFVEQLLAADVYVLGWTTESGRVEIRSIRDPDGSITPFFSSPSQLRATIDAMHDDDARFIRINCRALFGMLRGSRLVLDPHSRFGKIFSSEEVDLYATSDSGLSPSEVMPTDKA